MITEEMISFLKRSGASREMDAHIHGYAEAILDVRYRDYDGALLGRREIPFPHEVANYGAYPNYTGSIDAAVAFCSRVLPGWAWRVATCCVSDDAWVFPDFNSPEHCERLKSEFNPDLDWADLTDVDLRPSGRPAIALIISVLKAKLIIGGAA